jgi:uncharacterized membrane protein
MSTRSNNELRPSIHRIEFFSDAVFAIALTIMILEIQIPEILAERHDDAALRHIGGQLLIYLLSFVVIGIYWANHHFIVFTLPHADRLTLWLNHHVLFWVTLIPLVARFFGEHPTQPRAAAAYAFVMMMCTFALGRIRRHALGISGNELHRVIHARVFWIALAAIAIWAAAIPLAFVDIRLAWLCFLVVPAMFFLPVVRRPMDWIVALGSRKEALTNDPAAGRSGRKE